MSVALASVSKARTALSGTLIAAVVGVHPAQANGFTAGDLIREMPAKEFVAYVAGMIEGFAYARFRKDSLTAGAKVETGMQCIRDLYQRDPKAILTIEDAFRKYGEHSPSVVMAALIKKECGE